MTNFKSNILAQKNVAGASCDKGAIAVMALPLNRIVIWRGTGAVMSWEHRALLESLVIRAAAKLGYKKDRRCKMAWRKVGGI